MPARTCWRRQAEGRARFWADERPRREAQRAATSAAATSEIGSLTQREALIAGAIAYWCEGAKNKSYRRSDRVDFVNSDPLMIQFFLRFLETAGIARDRLVFRLSIHEDADVAAAQKFWLDLTTGASEEYHGCLRINVRRSIDLCRQVEGWAFGVMSAPHVGSDPSQV
jgi:hypothetical protein